MYLFAAAAGAEPLSVEVVVEGQLADGVQTVHRHGGFLL